jgi:hypothetical protein
LIGLEKGKENQGTINEVTEKLLSRPDIIGMIHGNVKVGNEIYDHFMAAVPNA